MSANGTLAVALPDELVDALAERVLPLLAERLAPADADGWLRGAKAIAAYLDCPPSRIWALHSAGRLECLERDGSALIAKRSDLDAWVRAGGGRRP